VNRCRGQSATGEACKAYRLHGEEWCFWHSPAHADEAAEARRLGGLRRRREGQVAGAYEFAGVDSVAGLQRLLEIAALESLAMENKPVRIRLLTGITLVGLKLLERQLADRELALATVRELRRRGSRK
jgi:hypothetical protein